MFLKTTFKDIWNDVWDYMSDTYFNISLDKYENLGLTPTATTLSVIIFGLFFGIVFAAIVVTLNKNNAGVPVRALLGCGAIGKENAKTLAELSLEKKWFTRYSLRRNLVVRKMVAFIPLSERDALISKPKKKPKHSERPLQPKRWHRHKHSKKPTQPSKRPKRHAPTVNAPPKLPM